MNRTGHTRILAAVFGIGGAVAMASSASVHADPVDNYAAQYAPAVCATLDAYPSFSGIEGVGTGIVSDTGWSYTDAGRVIKESIMAECPQYAALWNQFVATYEPTPAPTAPTMHQAV